MKIAILVLTLFFSINGFTEAAPEQNNATVTSEDPNLKFTPQGAYTTCAIPSCPECCRYASNKNDLTKRNTSPQNQGIFTGKEKTKDPINHSDVNTDQ